MTIGDRIPEVLGTDQDGREIKASDYRGRKIDVNVQNTEAYQFYINRGYHTIARDEVDADGKPLSDYSLGEIKR